MFRFMLAIVAILLLVSGIPRATRPAVAQDTLVPTVEALSTQVSALQTAVSKLEGTATLATPTLPATASPTETSDQASEIRGNGTRPALPLPLGEPARIGDYEVRILAVNDDAESMMLAASTSNEPARPRSRMVMVTIEFTYQGPESGSLFWDFTFQAIGPRGLGISNNDEAYDCGTEPHSLFAAPEMFPGATYDADICWQFPEDEADNLVIEIAPLFDFDDEARYFSLR